MADSRPTKVRFWRGLDQHQSTNGGTPPNGESTIAHLKPSPPAASPPVAASPITGDVAPVAIEPEPAPETPVAVAAAEVPPAVAAPRTLPHPARIGPFVLEPTAHALAGGVRVAATGTPGTAAAGRTVSVTLSPVAKADEPTIAARGASLPSLRHPALFPVLGAGVAANWAYVIQPPAPNRTLSDRLAATGPLPPAAVEAALKELAAAVSVMHAAGFAHGAIHPDNVLFDADQHVVLTGVMLASAPVMDIPADFAPYVAPERQEQPPDPASDQFGFAATALTMLAGKPPRAPGAAGLIGLDLGAPAAVTEVLVRGMASAPSDRFPSLEALTEAFRAAVEMGANALTASAYDAINARDTVMAKLLVEGALRLRPEHPQALVLRGQLQTGQATGGMGMVQFDFGGAPSGFDGPPTPLPLGFEMPQLAPVSTTTSGTNPWVAFGIGVAFCTILLVVGVVMVFMFMSQ